MKAEKLMSLVRMDRVPRRNEPTAGDRRWSKRREVWRQALIARKRVKAGAEIYWVLELAKALGFWSVWMTVFADDTQIRAQLRVIFRAPECERLSQPRRTIRCPRSDRKAATPKSRQRRRSPYAASYTLLPAPK